MPPADERIIINNELKGQNTQSVRAFACVCEKEKQAEKEKKEDKGAIKTHVQNSSNPLGYSNSSADGTSAMLCRANRV